MNLKILIVFLLTWNVFSMTDDDVKIIEESLNISLPEDYIITVLNYPKELLDRDKLKLEEGDEGPTNLQFINNSQEIIDLNNSTRKNYSEDDEFIWKSDYFQIGVDGCGGIYFIKLNENPTNVYFYHWEDGVSEYSKSFNDFSKTLVEFYLDAFE